MFEELISTLEDVDEAIGAGHSEAAQTILTGALLQLLDIYDHEAKTMQKLFPILETLREELKNEHFEEAREITSMLTTRFCEAQNILSTTTEPPLTSATGELKDHEKACARERDELCEHWRASGLTVTSNQQPEDSQTLIVTFPRTRKPKPE
jgi:hypothetical protein